MAPAKKFMFDMSFDVDAPPPVPDAGLATPEEKLQEAEDAEIIEEIEEEEILPTFSEEELEAAKKQAYELGHQEGTQNASETTERDTLAIIRAISQHITDLFGIQEQTNNRLVNDCIGISSSITQKLFPDLSDKNGAGEIDRLIEKTLLRLIDEPRVVIRINPGQIAQISERIDGLKAGSGYEGRVIIKDDENIAQGDCRLEWGEGSAERNAELLWNSIDEIIQGHLNGTRQPEHVDNTVDVNQEPEIATQEASETSATE